MFYLIHQKKTNKYSFTKIDEKSICIIRDSSNLSEFLNMHIIIIVSMKKTIIHNEITQINCIN